MATPNRFRDWLNAQLARKGWIQADLARASGITTAQISRIMSGRRGIGRESCNAIAKALGVPPETVLRAAGLLPDEPEENELTEELIYIFNQLTAESQVRAVAQLRALKDADERIYSVEKSPR